MVTVIEQKRMREILVRLARAVACRSRLRILTLIVQLDETTPTALSAQLTMRIESVSNHLKELMAVGLITRRPSGGFYYVRATPAYSVRTPSGRMAACLHARLRNADFALFHQQRISWIVVPLMVVEVTSTALLVHSPHAALSRTAAIAAAAFLAVAWLSTFLLQAPTHVQLLKGYDATLIAGLTTGNWLRTVAWSARAVILCMALQRCAAFVTKAGESS